MKRALLLTVLAFAPALRAQDASDILRTINLVLHPPSVALTVTATQGDGTICPILKFAGSTINLYLQCSLGSTVSDKGRFFTATGANPVATALYSGDVYILLLANPTSAAIPASGSMPLIPAGGVGYSYSTNIKTNGIVTGQTPATVGVITFP